MGKNGFARSMIALACFTLVATTITRVANGQGAERPEQLFVELTCDASGTAKLHTLSLSQVEPAWRNPAIAGNAPISSVRHIMRIHDKRALDADGRENPWWTTASFTHRMTRCRVGNSEIVARIRENGDYNDQADGYVRLWIDKRPMNLAILSLQNMSAEVNIKAQKIEACVDEFRIAGVGDPDLPTKRLCSSERFELGALDAIEFTANLIKGPNQNLVLRESNNRKLCQGVGAHLDGGPFPPGYAEPPSATAPKTWDQANLPRKLYRVDADNDGEIDDAMILDVDQHVYTGSVLAMFEKDTVLTSKVALPWWGDLLGASLSQSMRGGIEPKVPKEFNWATNAHDLGDYEAGWLDLFVHGHTTYVSVQEMRSMHHHEEYLVEPPAPAALGTIAFDNFEQLIVKLTADERAETICKFVYREEAVR